MGEGEKKDNEEEECEVRSPEGDRAEVRAMGRG